MSVLSDADIRRRIGRGGLSIEPFDEANLTPNGCDLSLSLSLFEIQVGGGKVQKAGRVTAAPGAALTSGAPEPLVGSGRATTRACP